MTYFGDKIVELLEFKGDKPEDAKFWVEDTIDTLHKIVNLLNHASTEKGLFKGMPFEHRLDAFLDATFAPQESSDGTLYPMNGIEGYQIMLAFRAAMHNTGRIHPKEREIYDELVKLLK